MRQLSEVGVSAIHVVSTKDLSDVTAGKYQFGMCLL